MKRTTIALLLSAVLALGMLTGCGGSGSSNETASTEEEAAKDDASQAEEEAPETEAALTVDEAAKTITIRAVATGQTESSIHMLVNSEGGNAGSAFFNTEATSQEFYDALVALGGVPGNNISLEDKDGTILGTGMDVKVSADGAEYGCYDLIDASEAREMDMRFGGNIATNLDLATGCIFCLESCPAGIASDAAYQFQEPIEFVPSDKMPEKGTEVTFTFTLDDTSMIVNEKAGTISLNAVSTGYTESTIHAVVNKDGGNADKTLFTTEASTKDFYDALKSLGAEDGNNIALDDKDGTIEGTSLDVNVEAGAEKYPFADLVTASEAREMDMRFGGNIDTNQELATGCVMCLESCPAGIVSDAAFQYQEKITFGPSDKMPEAGKHIIVTFTVAK